MSGRIYCILTIAQKWYLMSSFAHLGKALYYVYFCRFELKYVYHLPQGRNRCAVEITLCLIRKVSVRLRCHSKRTWYFTNACCPQPAECSPLDISLCFKFNVYLGNRFQPGFPHGAQDGLSFSSQSVGQKHRIIASMCRSSRSSVSLSVILMHTWLLKPKLP